MNQEQIECKYETGEMSGLDCPCEECQKCRDLIFQGEISGEVYLSGTEKDKGKIRR